MTEDKIVDIRSRMNLTNQNWDRLPKHIRRGFTIAKNMDQEELSALFEFLGQIILSDVEHGLKGEETEFLFDEIDKMYEQWQQEKEAQLKTCFFCDEETDVGVCLGCLVKKCGGGDAILKDRRVPEK